MKSTSAGRRLRAAAVLVLCAGCGFLARRVKPGEEFTLHPGERVVVTGAGVGVRLDAVGHQWYADGGAERPYATVRVTPGGAAQHSLTFGDTLEVHGHAVRLVAANPFQREGGPSATLVVTPR
ncbi:MAG TPA: hypothetical protein VF771_13030 [Longimicrobiaceae bacterium]